MMLLNPTCARPVVITTDRLVIKSLKNVDIELIRQWRNQPRIRNQLFDSNEITEAKQVDWWSKYIRKLDDECFVVHSKGNIKLGFIALYHIDRHYGTAEVGRMMIGKDTDLGRGYMTEALKAVRNYAFKQKGIRNIFLYVKTDNASAIACYRKSGFADVGPAKNNQQQMVAITTEPIKLSITLYVRERIRTVEMFLASMNKNSYTEGHEVVLVVDPEWINPSDPCYVKQFPDGSRGPNTPLKQWLETNIHRFPRLTFSIDEDWDAEGWECKSIGRRMINTCTGFNHAIRRGMKNEYFMTSMACDMYWHPGWDINLTKWIGAADIVIPRYVEIHPSRPEKPKVEYTGIGTFLYVDENDESSVCANLSPSLGSAIYESPKHRTFSHAVAVVMNRDTFDRIGGFVELPHPESTDLFFDDAAGNAGLLKVVANDSFAIHGTVYKPLLQLDEAINPSSCAKLICSERLKLLTTYVEKAAEERWHTHTISPLPYDGSKLMWPRQNRNPCPGGYNTCSIVS